MPPPGSGTLPRPVRRQFAPAQQLQLLSARYSEDSTIAVFSRLYGQLDDENARAHEDFAKFVLEMLFKKSSGTEHKSVLYQIAMEKIFERTKGGDDKALTGPHYLMLKSLGLVRLRIKHLLDEQEQLKIKPDKEGYADACRRKLHLKDREKRLEALLIYHANLKAQVRELFNDLAWLSSSQLQEIDDLSSTSSPTDSPLPQEKRLPRADSPSLTSSAVDALEPAIFKMGINEGINKVVKAVYAYTESVCAESINWKEFIARKEALLACMPSLAISDKSKAALTTLVGSVSAATLGLGVGLGIGFALAMLTGPGALLYMVTVGAVVGLAAGAKDSRRFSLQFFQPLERKMISNLATEGEVVVTPAG